MKKTSVAKLFANANADLSHTIIRAKAQKARLANIKDDMKPFINTMREMLNDSDLMHIVSGYEKPVVYLNIRNLESFKTGRIVQILQVLEAFGTADSTTDYAGIVNRDYKYNMGKYDVTLCAYVREDSPTCRKVAVGTEVQTVVKYEIQCD
jgi:hypothetical protein